MRRAGKDSGFSLVELIVVIAIIAVLTGVVAPTLFRYIERSREGIDNAAMGEFLNQLYLSAAADIEAYESVTDEGQLFSKEADDDTWVICPEEGGTLYEKSVAKYLGTDTLVFKSRKWTAAAMSVKVNLTWDGIRLEYSDSLKELMGAENLRYE